MHKKHKGAHSELVACAWLLREGYEVFRNISPVGHIDLVAIKDYRILKLDVKSALPSGSRQKVAPGVTQLDVYPDGHCVLHSPEGQCDPPISNRMGRKKAAVAQDWLERANDAARRVKGFPTPEPSNSFQQKSVVNLPQLRLIVNS